MSQLGFGVIIQMLGGNADSVEAFQSGIGKVIKGLSIDEKNLNFTFADDTKIRLTDEGQSCCEYRWMHTDDDLDYFVGSTLLGGEVREGPEEKSDYDDVKESEFLIIQTSLGEFTVVNYNSHNGYYGGFCIRASKVNK